MNIKDIAFRAGVSISTVSRVINNTAFVKPEIKNRVEKIIEETGYRPNALAKELQKNKTNVIGVLIPRLDLTFFSMAVDGITKVLNENGYSILLANTREKLEEELKYFRLFQDKRVDGVLYFATGITDEHVDFLSKMEYPIVCVGQSYEKLNLPSVTYDNFNGSRAIVNHMINNGYKNIGFIGVSDYDEQIGKKRKEGYLRALRENGIEPDQNIMAIGGFEYIDGYNGMQIIEQNNRGIPTALYAITDRLAIGAMHYLIERGYSIPEDIAVAGTDNLDISLMVNPPLSTVGFDCYRAGIEAAEIILECINKKMIIDKRVVLDFELKIRKSL